MDSSDRVAASDRAGVDLDAFAAILANAHGDPSVAAKAAALIRDPANLVQLGAAFIERGKQLAQAHALCLQAGLVIEAGTLRLDRAVAPRTH